MAAPESDRNFHRVCFWELLLAVGSHTAVAWQEREGKDLKHTNAVVHTWFGTEPPPCLPELTKKL